MSISLYTGSPGSGKSFHCTKEILSWLDKGKNVISNYNITLENENLHIISDETLTVKYLIDFAKANHQKGSEMQTLVVIDEAQLKFNSRAWKDKGRVDWNKFFTVHRHLGYEIILATQKDSFLDSQIRGLIEYNVIHKNIKKSKLGFIFPFMPTMFVALTYWYHSKMQVKSQICFLNKRVLEVYDSYIMFDKILKELSEE